VNGKGGGKRSERRIALRSRWLKKNKRELLSLLALGKLWTMGLCEVLNQIIAACIVAVDSNRVNCTELHPEPKLGGWMRGVLSEVTKGFEWTTSAGSARYQFTDSSASLASTDVQLRPGPSIKALRFML
jgi:hypothetical protein